MKTQPLTRSPRRRPVLSGISRDRISAEPLEARIAPAVVITGTLNDTFTDGDGDGKAELGQLITYLGTIAQTGDIDALNLQIQTILDSQTTLTTFNVSPLALNDGFVAIGNTLLRVGGTAGSGPERFISGGNVLANDLDFYGDTFTAVAVTDAATTQGGKITLSADGTFTYMSAPGFNGTDAYTYTVRDNGPDNIAGNADDLTNTATVTITVNSTVWYVDSAYAGANGASDGTSLRPFTSLTPLHTGGTADSLDDAGDTIYVHKGGATTAGNLLLENNQRLIGGLTTLVADGTTLINGAAGNDATLVGNITLGSGNQIRGLDIASTTGIALSGTNFGVLTIRDVEISNSNGAAISLTTGTADIGILSLSSTNAAAGGIVLTGVSGTFIVSGTTTVTNSNSSSLQVVNSGGTFSFGTVNINSRNGTGIFLDNNDGGSLRFGAVTIPNPDSSGGYGVRLEDSTSSTYFTSLTVSNTTQTVDASDTDGNDIPDNEGDGDAVFVTNNAGTLTIAGGTLSGLAADGIDFRNSGSLIVSNVTINDIARGAQVTTSAEDAGINVLNMTGNLIVTDSTISRFHGPAESLQDNGIRVQQFSTSFGEVRLDNVTVFNDEQTDGDPDEDPRGGHGLYFATYGTVNGTVTVANSVFRDLTGDGVFVNAGNDGGAGAGGGLLNVVVTDTQFLDSIDAGAAVPTFGGLQIVTAGFISAGNISSVSLNVRLEGNTFNDLYTQNANNHSVLLLPRSTGNFTAVVDGNTFNGSAGRGAFRVATGDLEGEVLSSFDLTFSNNTANDVRLDGLLLDIRGDSLTNGTTGNVRILNNNFGSIARVADGGFEGMWLRVRDGVGANPNQAKTVNMLVSNNIVRNLDNSVGDEAIDVDSNNNSTINLTMIGNTADTTGVATNEIDMSTSGTSTINVDFRNNTATHNGGGGATTVFNTAGGGTINLESGSNTGNSPNATGTVGSIASVPMPTGVIASSNGFVQDANLSSGFATNLQTIVRNPDGTPAVGVTVTFAAPGSGASGTFTGGATAVTDASGIASKVFTANATAGRYVVTATAAGFTGTGNFFLINNAAAPNVPTLGSVSEPGSAGGATSDSPATAGTVVGDPTAFTLSKLPAGKTLTVAYGATVNNNITASQVSSQIITTGTNFTTVNSNDPNTPAANDATVTLVDLPDVSVAVNQATVAEDGSGNFIYTFTRTGPNDFARVVNFSATGSAAFGGANADFTVSSGGAFAFDTATGLGTVTFASGSSTATITVSPNDDVIVENNETAIITVTSGTGYEVGTPSAATGTINNDDNATLTLSGGIAQSEGNSGTIAYTFTVTLSNPVQGGFNVPFTTNNGTATTADGDYVDNDGTLTFAGTAGETQTITVLVNGDNKVELDETFTVNLGTLTGSSATQLAAITPSGSPQTGTINNDDSATVSIVANVSQAENLTPQQFTISLSNPVDTAVTVLFNTSDGTATIADSDYTAITNQTVTFAAGTTTAQVVNVTISNDNKVEANETYNVAIGTLGASGRNVSLGTTTGTGTIVNDDAATVTISGGGSAAEGNSGTTPRVFTVTLNNPVQGGFTLPFTTNDGTATVANGDYVDNDGTLTFLGTAGETQTITVLVNGDIIVENDETFTVALGSISGAPAGVTTAGSPQTATVANDDTDVSVSLGAPTSVAEDGSGNLVYTFTRSGVLTSALTVNVNVSGTASFTGDYSQNFATFNTGSGVATVTFLANSSTAVVTIDPTADASGEPNETVILTLATGANYNVINPTSATGTILNDDTIVSLAVSPASVTENSGALTYTFTRTGDTTTATTVNFTYAGTALVTDDYAQAGAATFAAGLGTIVIPIGQSSATVTLTPVNDALVEGNETSILTLAAGGDYGIGAQNTATGTINDNDTATIAYSLASNSIAENGVNAALGFVLTINANGTGTPALARDVTFNVTTGAGGTALGAGTDYALPATVTFATGALNNATQLANVAINNDRIVEGSETANLGLAIGMDNTGGQVSIIGGAGSSHVLTITDNDTATIGYATTTSSVSEGSANHGINLVLTINADGSGTPSLGAAADFQISTTGGTASGTGTDYSLPGVVSFPSGSLSGATQSASLALINDVLVEGSETAVLGVAMGSNTMGGQVTIASAANSHTATITDNDTATIGFSTTTSSVAETAGTSALGVVLTINANGTGTPALARDVTFNVTAAGGTATGGGADYSLPATVTFASGALNNATQSTNLTINNDTIVEGSEVANLGLAIGIDSTFGQVTIAGGAASSHAATITDNDTAVIRLLSAGSSVTESTASQAINFELVITGNGTVGTGTLGSEVSVNVEQLINGTASLADISFTNPQNFTFAAGSASGQRTATVGIVNDTLVEGTEILDYRLSGLSETTGGAVTLSGPAQHTLTITDNDTATIGFVQNASTTAEDGTPAIGVVLTITANGQVGTGSLERAVSLNVSTTGGTATGADYTFSSPQTITFAAGAISGTQNAAITLNNDTVVEGAETLVLGAGGLVDNTLGQVTQTATTQHTLTITDNDTAVVQFTQLTGSVQESSEGANVGVTLVITANGEPNTGTLGQDVTVNVGVMGGTAAGGGVDYDFNSPATLTFAAGSTSGTRSAGLSVNNDMRVEGSETIAFGLSSLNGPAGQVSLGAQTAHALTIVDNDTATVSLATNSFTVPEAAGTANVNVVLTITANGQTGQGSLEKAVSVDLATLGGGATGGGVDYSFTSPQTITFPVDSTSSTKGGELTIINDTVLEFNEFISVGAQNFVDGTGSQVTFTGGTTTGVNITDNETATISFVSATSSTGEAAGNQQVGVKLTIIGNGVEGIGTLGFDGTAIQVLNAGGGSATDVTDYSFTSPQLVTFSNGESSGTKFVTVGVVDDNFSEGSETVNLGFGQVNDPSERGAITVIAPTTHTVTIVDNDIDLAVSKTASTPTVVAGSGASNLTYTVTVTNNGLTTATNVVLGDDLTLPAGASFVSAAPSQGTYATNANPDGTWTIGTLAPGASATLTVVLTVDASAAEGAIVSNTATITGSDEVRVLTQDDSATATATIDRQIDVSVAVTDAVTTAVPGDTLSYLVSYTNNGPSDASGVVLTQNLPAGTTFNAAASAAGWVDQGGGVFTLSVGGLASGANGSATFVVNVTNPAAAGLATLTTTSTIADDLSAGSDVVPGNNTATDIDTLNAAPDLRIGIVDDPTVAHRGGVTKYLVTYANIGNQDATGGFITMNLPANTSFDIANSTGIWVAQGGGVYRMDLGNLAAGAVDQTVAFAVKVNAVLPGGYNVMSTTGTVGDDGLNGTDQNLVDNTETETTPFYQGIYVVAPGINVPSKRIATPVLVYDVATGELLHSINAYEATYRDSIRVAVGDINGDGFDDIITSTRSGSGRVRVFDGVTGERFEGPFSEIAAFTEKGAKGAFVASGDVTGDGRDDIIVGSGQGAKGAGKVRVFDGVTGTQVADFQPFATGFRGGVRVAVGDVNGDGLADIIASQGFGGNDVVVTSGSSSTVLHDLEIGGNKYKGGVFVAAGDVDGDSKSDLIVGRDRGNTIVETYSGATGLLMDTIVPFDSKYRLGARVAAADLNLDGIADIIVGSGGRNLSTVKIFNGVDQSLLHTFQAFPLNPTGSLFVAGSSPVPAQPGIIQQPA